MNTDFIPTHLKLLFSTLFLKTYKLPEVGAILNLIEQSCKDLHSLERCFENLSYVNIKLQDLKETLVYFSTSDFLGHFDNLEESYKAYDFPIDFSNSCHEFFKKFFDVDYTPGNSYDLDELLEFIQYIVQFEEATPARVHNALDLMEEVTQLMSVKFEWLMPKNTSFPEIDRDTKPCDCFEYEASGDCSCLYDF